MEHDTSKKVEELRGKFKKFLTKFWHYIKFAKMELIIIFSAIFFDLLTKFLIDKFMEPRNPPHVLIRNFLQFYYVLNDSAAFGSAFGLEKILNKQEIRVFFIIFTIITLAFLFYLLYYFRNKGRFVRVGFGMVIGGALGNFYDRVVYGAVRDFVEIVFFGYDVPFIGETFAIFNLADAFLTIGMVVLMIFFAFKYKEKEKEAGTVTDGSRIEKAADVSENENANAAKLPVAEEKAYDIKTNADGLEN